MQSTQ
jgi:hypothetical protein